jgi:hypothetical protein
MTVKKEKFPRRWLPGGIHEIDLKDGTFAYAQALLDPDVAFYECLRKEKESRPSLESVVTSKILFKVGMYEDGIRKEWERIGRVPLKPELENSEDCFLYHEDTDTVELFKVGVGIIPATWEEVKHLERLALWGHGSVEQRLRDHFAGRPNWDLESDKPGWKFIPIKEFYAQYGYNFHWMDEESDKET